MIPCSVEPSPSGRLQNKSDQIPIEWVYDLDFVRNKGVPYAGTLHGIAEHMRLRRDRQS